MIERECKRCQIYKRTLIDLKIDGEEAAKFLFSRGSEGMEGGEGWYFYVWRIFLMQIFDKIKVLCHPHIKS